jgi:hypothetical protein
MAEAATLTEINKVQLEEQLKTLLETWPLYSRLDYRGAEDADKLPANIYLRCIRCKGVQRWTRPLTNPRITSMNRANVIKHRGGFNSVEYTCANCPGPHSLVRFYFSWQYSADTKVGHFMKVGQWPPLDESVPDTLAGKLDQDDLDLYKKAIRLRNHNLGIGAVAYLRRVVENRINDILDALAEAAREHAFAAEELKTIEKVKAGHRFDDKIDYAAKLLPTHLRPAGKPNPIDKLHELTSAGLHSKTEAECVEIFDRVKTVFEYVFGNLRVQAEEARDFVKSLGGLVSLPGGSKKLT